ncbi:MAG: hypothetical protein RL342_666, partial [Pseudomonadota bacterium]
MNLRLREHVGRTRLPSAYGRRFLSATTRFKRSDSGLVDGLADVAAAGASGLGLGGYRGRVDALRCSKGSQQALASRVGGGWFGQGQTGTSQRDLGQPLWPAKGVAALQQLQQACGIELGAGLQTCLLLPQQLGQFATGRWHAQAIGKLAQQAHAAAFMAQVARPQIGRRAALAQVMAQTGKTYGQRRVQPRAQIEHQQQVHTGVYFRVMLGALR